jgi:HK97 family phage prohead protease
MDYLQAKATATNVDQDLGEFTAVVATYDRDREGDEIQPGAFAESIWQWRSVGRRLPLHWNHDSDLIVGDINPAEMWEDDDAGLEVSGRVDLDDELGRKVWKQLKANRLGFSFGYLATKTRERRDGGRDLLEIDVFEISATPSPMNNMTRVLATKAATDWKAVPRYAFGDELMTYSEIVEHASPSRRERVWREIKEASAEIAAAEEAEQAAARTPAPPQIPVSDKPFVTDSGERLVVCSADGCNAIPTMPSGAWLPVRDRRWWCPRHRDRAGAHDHLPEPPTYILNENLGLRLNPESETAQSLRREEEDHREEERQRQEADDREARALAEVRRRYENTATVSVNGIRIKPANMTVDGA